MDKSLLIFNLPLIDALFAKIKEPEIFNKLPTKKFPPTKQFPETAASEPIFIFLLHITLSFNKVPEYTFNSPYIFVAYDTSKVDKYVFCNTLSIPFIFASDPTFKESSNVVAFAT